VPPLDTPIAFARTSGHRLDSPRPRRRTRLQSHPGLSGIEAVSDGRVALGLRLALARAADTINRRPDFPLERLTTTGTVMFEEMLGAAGARRARAPADRRRQHQGMDPIWRCSMRSRTSSCRLYNPFVGRGSRTLGSWAISAA
jgi:hypothetical protein